MPTQQIIAMGGGGFSMEPENLALDRYILAASGVPNPKVCFLPTASGDAQSYIDRFYAAFTTLPCTPSHLSLFQPHTADIPAFLLEQNVIYASGGSTRNLMALWREWQLDRILLQAWQSGIVLAGISAGSLCWFEEGLSDSVIAGDLRPMRCLGFLPGSHSPHYDGEPGRRPAYHRLIAEQKLSPGYAADDGAALHFTGTALTRVVSSRPAAKAYRVRWTGTEVEETPLPTDLLTS
jgi:peptidase E